MSAGVDFVGWHTWATHRVSRRRTLHALDRRLRRFERQRVWRAFGGAAHAIDLFPPPLPVPRRVSAAHGALTAAQLPATLASYAGYLRHGAAWRAWRRQWDAHPWLAALFRDVGWAPRARWAAPHLWSDHFGRRYRALVRAAADDGLVFVRLGNHVEFLGRQRLLAQRALGLRPTPIARRQYTLTAGFHRVLGPRFVRRALAAGNLVVLAGGARTPPPRVLTPRPLPSAAAPPCTGRGRR